MAVRKSSLADSEFWMVQQGAGPRLLAKVAELLREGADPRATAGGSKMTPLHLAVKWGASVEVVKLLLEADAAAPVDTFLYDLRLVPSGAVQRNVDLETTLKRPPEGLQLHPPEEASYRIVPGGSSRGAGFADALGVGVGGRGEGRGGRGGRGGGNVSFHVNFNDSAIGNEGNDGIDNNNNNNINNINNNDDDNDDSISSLGGGGGPRRLSDGTAVEVKAGAGHGWERVCEVAGSRRMSIAHAVDTHRNTPLHLALKHRCGAEIVGLLLAQEGADAHAPNDDAMTPIHLAVSHRASPDVVGLLLARGVDVLAVGGAQEWTPLYWAVRQKAGPEVIALLRTAAAAATAVTGASGAGAGGGGAGGGGGGGGEGGGGGYGTTGPAGKAGNAVGGSTLLASAGAAVVLNGGLNGGGRSGRSGPFGSGPFRGGGGGDGGGGGGGGGVLPFSSSFSSPAGGGVVINTSRPATPQEVTALRLALAGHVGAPLSWASSPTRRKERDKERSRSSDGAGHGAGPGESRGMGSGGGSGASGGGKPSPGGSLTGSSISAVTPGYPPPVLRSALRRQY